MFQFNPLVVSEDLQIDIDLTLELKGEECSNRLFLVTCTRNCIPIVSFVAHVVVCLIRF